MKLNKNWNWLETDSEQFVKALELILNTRKNIFISGPGGVDLFRFSKLL